METTTAEDAMGPVQEMFSPAPTKTKRKAGSARTITTTLQSRVSGETDEELEASIFTDDSLVFGERPTSRKRYNATCTILGITFFFVVAPREALTTFAREATEVERTGRLAAQGQGEDVEAMIEAEEKVMADLERVHDELIVRCVSDWSVADDDGHKVACTPERLATMTMPVKSELVNEIISRSKLGRGLGAFLS